MLTEHQDGMLHDERGTAYSQALVERLRAKAEEFGGRAFGTVLDALSPHHENARERLERLWTNHAVVAVPHGHDNGQDWGVEGRLGLSESGERILLDEFGGSLDGVRRGLDEVRVCNLPAQEVAHDSATDSWYLREEAETVVERRRRQLERFASQAAGRSVKVTINAASM